MKVGFIAEPNKKGQIKKVITKEEEPDLLKVLSQTQGAWADDKSWDDTEKRGRKIELAASLKRKKAW